MKNQHLSFDIRDPEEAKALCNMIRFIHENGMTYILRRDAFSTELEIIAGSF